MRILQKVMVAALIAAGIVIAAAPVSSQNYPNRPVRLVVPTLPGSGSDAVARLISQPLAERLGQQVVVDNRAGAANMIAGEIVAKSAPDGYTLLMATTTSATVPAMYTKVPYDLLRDFAPITQMTSQPNVLVVHPSLPATTVRELIALAKAKPGEITFASAGSGTIQHVMMEAFLMMAGARMLHVPYKSPAPAFIDVVAGRVWVMLPSVLGAAPHVRADRLRPLGVTSAKRAAIMPDLPTLAEAGVPGYEAAQWWGLVAPAGTSREIIARLNKDVVSVLHTQDIYARLAKDGAEVVAGSPDEFGILLRTEVAKWAKVVKSAGIKAD